MEDYKKKAREFLSATNTEYHAVYLGRKKYFPDDKKERDVWHITLSNARGSYSFNYGDSVINTEKQHNASSRHKPDAYSVLSCLQKYEPESDIDMFAAEYGYTKLSEAIKTYEAVKVEWAGIKNLFTAEEIEKLQEIN